MKKQCIIVGLGRYGTTIAKKLSDEGVEVLAVDNDMKLASSKYEVKYVSIPASFKNLCVNSFLFV